MAEDRSIDTEMGGTGSAGPSVSANNGNGMNGSASAPSSNGSLSVSSLKDQALEQGSALLNQSKEVAGQAFDSAKSQVKTQLSTQKDRAADSLTSAVRALEATGQQFRDNDLGFIAGYADNLTGQVRQMTDYLQNRDIDDLTRDVEDFARRNPAVFVGGAFLLGVALARFLKSSNTGVSYASSNENALVPVGSSGMPSRLSTSRAFTDTESNRRNSDTYGDRPITAHGYVPGVGVTETNPNV